MTGEYSETRVEQAIEALQTVARASRHESGIITVDLLRNQNDSTLRRYAGCFKALPRFSLDLGGTSITDDGLRYLSEANGLEYITLTGRSEVTGAGFRFLADLPKLNSLYLDGSGVTDEGMAGIGRVKNLTRLWLRLNYVRDEGLWHLRNLHRLERLALENSLITDEGLQYIGQLTKMRQLHIDRCKITDAGLEHLTSLRQLEWLDVSQTQITGAGLTALPRLDGMRELDLSKTQMSDDVIDLMVRFPNLQKLDVSDTRVTAHGIQQLRRILPKCDVVPKMPTGTRATDPVFGRLVWAGQEPEWEGTIEVATLATFHCRWSMSSDWFYEFDDYDPAVEYGEPNVEITIKDPDGTGPSVAQRRAILLLREHEERICGDMLRSILAHLRTSEDAFDEDFHGPPEEGEQRERIFSQLDEPDGMREILQLGRIIVHRREKDGYAYLNFDFGCSWDEEHGLCAIMHKNRVVEIGEMGSLSVHGFDYSSFYPDEGEPIE